MIEQTTNIKGSAHVNTNRPATDGILLDYQNATYDRTAKHFLSRKKLLAWVLKHVVDEFRPYPIDDIAEKYIEGDPSLTVGTIPIDTNLTNAARAINELEKSSPENIKGSRNEDATATEGTAIFDIVFRAIAPTTGEQITLIINVEPQKTVHLKYNPVRRAIFYASRLISSQKETEFHGEDFNNIKKVYPIWITMDALEGSHNTIRQYSIREKNLYGHGHEETSNYDLMTVIMIYLGEGKTKHRLLKLLHLIFLDKLKSTEKKFILKRDYDITLTPTMEKELSEMGSLAEGIAERAEEKGRREGVREGRKDGERSTMAAIRMIKDNKPFETIIKKTGMTLASLTELKAML